MIEFFIKGLNALLNNKSDKLTTYTKNETDNLLLAKANQNTTYTILQVNNLFGSYSIVKSPKSG